MKLINTPKKLAFLAKVQHYFKKVLIGFILFEMAIFVLFNILPFNFNSKDVADMVCFSFFAADILFIFLSAILIMNKHSTILTTILGFIGTLIIAFSSIGAFFLISILVIISGNSESVIFQNKEYPNITIKRSSFDIGAYDSGGGSVDIVKEIRMPIINLQTAIDTNLIDRSRWIRVKKMKKSRKSSKP